GVARRRVRRIRRRGRRGGSRPSERARQRSAAGANPRRGRRRRPGWLAGSWMRGRPRELTVASACSVRVRGVVQGVGFRPFVFRLATRNTLAGWVLNAGDGVDIHVEGADHSLRAFLRDLEISHPPPALITAIEIEPAPPEGLAGFVIRESAASASPTV